MPLASPPSIVLSLLLALAAGCGGTVTPGSRDGGQQDRKILWTEGPSKPQDGPRAVDRPRGLDLTAKVGDPCTYGKCGEKLICMANICMAMCTQPMAQCNDKVTTCKASEACMYASDFTDACYPATAQIGQPCDMAKAIWCAGGGLCVKVGTQAPKCLKLCKYGCTTGTQCGKTNNNCDVCIY